MLAQLGSHFPAPEFCLGPHRRGRSWLGPWGSSPSSAAGQGGRCHRMPPPALPLEGGFPQAGWGGRTLPPPLGSLNHAVPSLLAPGHCCLLTTRTPGPLAPEVELRKARQLNKTLKDSEVTLREESPGGGPGQQSGLPPRGTPGPYPPTSRSLLISAVSSDPPLLGASRALSPTPPSTVRVTPASWGNTGLGAASPPSPMKPAKDKAQGL